MGGLIQILEKPLGYCEDSVRGGDDSCGQQHLASI